MRCNFAEVLKRAKIDIRKEYSKLYDLFYGKDKRDKHSLADLISLNFETIYFRGTCLDLDDFNQQYGFNFVKQPEDFNIDYLVSFCEYIYNFVVASKDEFFFMQNNKMFYMTHILNVIESIGYMQSIECGFTIFVEKNQAAISVSEIIPEEISYKVISYNHHTYKGNLENKRETLVKLAYYLEPKESCLASIDNQFKSDLFYLLNTLGLRHNNLDSEGAKYKPAIAKMSKEELENWYDETYQMCLLAFLRIEHNDRKKAIIELKKKAEKKESNT